MADVLDRFAELEWRYDGPIPEPDRDCVYGSAQRRLLIEAQGQADLFAALVRDQIDAIRRARRTGAVPGHLLKDLKVYRKHEFLWRREMQRLDAAVTPSADDVP